MGTVNQWGKHWKEADHLTANNQY